MAGFVPWGACRLLEQKNTFKEQRCKLILNVLFKGFKEIVCLRCMLLCSILCLPIF